MQWVQCGAEAEGWRIKAKKDIENYIPKGAAGYIVVDL